MTRQSFIPRLLAATLVLGCAQIPFLGQAVPAAQITPQSKTKSLAEVLKQPNRPPLHFLYVHGIADGGPDDRDSWYLRHGICTILRCTDVDGNDEGSLIFANQPPFLAAAPPPDLKYLGQPVFPTDSTGYSEAWAASAPFMRRYVLQPQGGGASVYVDELNWWPLVFALKCRQMVAADAHLLGADANNLADCTASALKDPDTGHFSSYPFLDAQEAATLRAFPKRGALINRGLKGGVMDWGFSDAVLSLGPLRALLLEGLRQLIQSAVRLPGSTAADPLQDQDFIFVTHSLGSYLIFAALDLSDTEAPQSALSQYDVLAHTSRVYFFANQLRLLEFANLESAHVDITQHLKTWTEARKRYFAGRPDLAADAPPAQIIAWNDASDLLTWEVPAMCGVSVQNYTVRNTWNWFGLVESPTKAHDYYGLNRRVVSKVLHEPGKIPPPTPCPAGDTVATIKPGTAP